MTVSNESDARQQSINKEAPKDPEFSVKEVASMLIHVLHDRGFRFSVSPGWNGEYEIKLPEVYGECQSGTIEVTEQGKRIRWTTTHDYREEVSVEGLAHMEAFCAEWSKGKRFLYPSFDDGVYSCTVDLTLDELPTVGEIVGLVTWQGIEDELLWSMVSDFRDVDVSITESIAVDQSCLREYLLDYVASHGVGRLIRPRHWRNSSDNSAEVRP